MSNISIYKNILDEQFRRELLEESIKLIQSSDHYVWKTNYSWQPSLVQRSRTVLTRLYDVQTASKILDQLFKKEILDSNGKYYVMNYVWTHDSYIPWHTDDHVVEAMTIYLNDFWEKDWGGYFLWLENDQLHGHMPKRNTAVKNTNKIPHHVTPITSSAQQFRYTVQIWRKN